MTIFLDVTELFGLELTSGIQRVVREIVGRSNSVTQGNSSEIVPVVALGGRFYRVDRATLFPAAKRSVPSPNRPSLPGKKADRSSGLKAIVRRLPPLQRYVQRLRFEKGLRRKQGLDSTPVTPSADDRVVLLDSFWSGSSAIDAAAHAKSADATIIVVVYDLIPIHHPDQVPQSLALGFRHNIFRALRLADGVVTISKQTSREVIETDLIAPNKIQHFYLGHNFTGHDRADTDSSSGPSLLPHGVWAEDTTVYLMVGTIEPRKNHAMVLEAFEELWRAGGQQSLLIIGKTGWGMDAFVARCQAHSLLGKRLFLVSDASDAALVEAMSRADAAIMASWLEGFGLPVVEALSSGLPVLASDIPVFREIADGAAQFFTCNDPNALAAAIVSFEANRDVALEQARSFDWINWDQSTAQFYAAINTVSIP